MSAASKITKVVTDFFLPLADGFVPEYTPLSSTPDDEEALLLEKISDTFPECMGTREDFVAKMGEIYDTGRQLRAEAGRNKKRARISSSASPEGGGKEGDPA